MSKLTSGVIAAIAAAALLLGAAGTLAVWNDSRQADLGSMSTGHLELTDFKCEPFEYTNGAKVGAKVTDGMVPGDEIKASCDGTLELVGDNIAAEVVLSSTAWETLVRDFYEISESDDHAIRVTAEDRNGNNVNISNLKQTFTESGSHTFGFIFKASFDSNSTNKDLMSIPGGDLDVTATATQIRLQ